jgi:class 3 adenylate cyclase
MGPIGIRVRVGIHSGEIEPIGDDIAGIAVHIAHRICCIALGGTVLVSSTVKDLVSGSQIQFSDEGTHELKGVPGSRHLFAAKLLTEQSGRP